MRLTGISRIIEAEVRVICRSRRLHMDNYQNDDLITTKKSNKMFSKQEYFQKPAFTSFTVCWRDQK